MLRVQQEQVVGFERAGDTQSRIALAGQHVVAVDGRYARMLLHEDEDDPRAAVGQTLSVVAMVQLARRMLVVVVL